MGVGGVCKKGLLREKALGMERTETVGTVKNDAILELSSPQLSLGARKEGRKEKEEGEIKLHHVKFKEHVIRP